MVFYVTVIFSSKSNKKKWNAQMKLWHVQFLFTKKKRKKKTTGGGTHSVPGRPQSCNFFIKVLSGCKYLLFSCAAKVCSLSLSENTSSSTVEADRRLQSCRSESASSRVSRCRQLLIHARRLTADDGLSIASGHTQLEHDTGLKRVFQIITP